ncbi:MAG: DinB family protein [Caldimonas sp.]
MDLLHHLRICARANRLANHRLHESMSALSQADFEAPRTGFFPSLAATLNHVLAVDVYYLAALHREADMVAQFEARVACRELAELAVQQRRTDERLIRFVDSLDAADLDGEIVLDRGEMVLSDRCGYLLGHLFMHQTHHRGQAHAMLSGTAVAPPQLDEFMMPSDAPNRVADLRSLGWTEHDLFGA